MSHNARRGSDHTCLLVVCSSNTPCIVLDLGGRLVVLGCVSGWRDAVVWFCCRILGFDFFLWCLAEGTFCGLVFDNGVLRVCSVRSVCLFVSLSLPLSVCLTTVSTRCLCLCLSLALSLIVTVSASVFCMHLCRSIPNILTSSSILFFTLPFLHPSPFPFSFSQMQHL